MTHLSVEEIIEFVSFDKINNETLPLASKVNDHMRSCQNCMDKVSAFQAVYYELTKVYKKKDVKKSLYTIVSEETLNIKNRDELSEAIHASMRSNTVDYSR